MIVDLGFVRQILGVGVSVSDDVLQACADAAEAAILPLLKTVDGSGTAIAYVNVPGVVQACTNATVDIYRQQKASGSNYQGLDMAPNPFFLGRSLVDRYAALLTGYRDVKAELG